MLVFWRLATIFARLRAVTSSARNRKIKYLAVKM